MLKLKTNTKTGIPQGFTLGPLFFKISITDLITISNTLKFTMYADDTSIYLFRDLESNQFDNK